MRASVNQQEKPRPLADFYPEAEGRKRAHYFFAHRFLPSLVHANPRDFFVTPALWADPTAFVRSLWQLADPRASYQGWQVGDLAARLETINGWPALLVQLPPPESFPPALAFFIAIVLQPPDPDSPEVPKARVLTLERTLDGIGIDPTTTGVLCAWTANGRHRNLCQFVAVTRLAFLEAVKPFVERPAAGDLPQNLLHGPGGTEEPRGRNAILEEFGLPEQMFVLHYVSYFMALVFNRAPGGWNNDIEGFARSLGALRESEIALAKTNFHQAILNRIMVRSVAGKARPRVG